MSLGKVVDVLLQLNKTNFGLFDIYRQCHFIEPNKSPMHVFSARDVVSFYKPVKY